MPIPQSQLETWSHQGSVTQSKNTYATIKAALESVDAKYKSRNFKVFLQGSYGNDTNIYAESDVDIVIRQDASFYYELHDVPTEQKNTFDTRFPESSDYSYSVFQSDVKAALTAAFADSVKSGKKAIRIQAGGARRSADVITAFEFRRYYKFVSDFDEHHVKGIAFFTSDGSRIDNFPTQHRENCTLKHQATNCNYKPMVRILKNMRSRLVDDGLLEGGIAPSYYIEGLLYNVPDDKFVGDYANILYNVLKWLQEIPDRTKFVCANELYYLLRDASQVCWPKANGEKFITAAISLWNNW